MFQALGTRNVTSLALLFLSEGIWQRSVLERMGTFCLAGSISLVSLPGERTLT